MAYWQVTAISTIDANWTCIINLNTYDIHYTIDLSYLAWPYNESIKIPFITLPDLIHTEKNENVSSLDR